MTYQRQEDVTTLIATVGVQGSGKSHQAKLWQQQDPLRRARVNRDLLRIMMHGGWTGQSEAEDQVSAMQLAGVQALLRGGTDVIVDDTNLSERARASLVDVAAAAGARLQLWDFTGVPLNLCLERNSRRSGPARLDDQIIIGTYDRYLAGTEIAADRPLLAGMQHLITRSWS